MSDNASLIMRICNSSMQLNDNIVSITIDDITKNNLEEDFLILNNFYNNTKESKSYNINVFRKGWEKLLFAQKLENELKEKIKIKGVKI